MPQKILIGILVVFGVLMIIGVVIWMVIYFRTSKNNHEPQTTRLRVTNNCSEDLWVQQLNLPGNDTVIHIPKKTSHDYVVPDGGTTSTRLWPKTKCDATGKNCQTGQSQAPCPSKGCQPPFESKAEFTFGDLADPSARTAYDISFVDGYTLPISIIAKGSDAGTGNCQTLDCSGMVLSKCPTDDNLAGTTHIDLQVKDPTSGEVIACIGPCQYITQPPPWGMGKHDISVDPGLHMCCPTPCEYLKCQTGDACNCEATNCTGCTPTAECTWTNGCATSNTCSNSSDPKGIKNTKYYSTIKKICPHAYGYAYDDNPNNPTNVLMTCSAEDKYEVVFCPSS